MWSIHLGILRVVDPLLLQWIHIRTSHLIPTLYLFIENEPLKFSISVSDNSSSDRQPPLGLIKQSSPSTTYLPTLTASSLTSPSIQTEISSFGSLTGHTVATYDTLFLWGASARSSDRHSHYYSNFPWLLRGSPGRPLEGRTPPSLQTYFRSFSNTYLT